MTSGVPAPGIAAPAGTGWDELVAGLEVGVLLLDGSGAVLAANPRAAELLGFERADLLRGVLPDGWTACDDLGAPVPAVADLCAQAFGAGLPASGPVVITTHGERHRRLWAEVQPLPLRGRRLVLAVLHPVQTDLWRGKGLLDPLTGLPNRALLFDRLEQALIRARTHGTMASVILTDLCGLGDINRTWGFRCGDRVLGLISARLRQELRADHTVGRYAGGTFAVVADHPHGTGEPIAERITAIARGQVDLGHCTLRPAVRTSWATSDGGGTVHELIGLAATRLRHD